MDAPTFRFGVSESGGPAAGPARPLPPQPWSSEVALLLLADIAPAARLWGWSRFVVGRYPLRRVPGLRFFKVLGSGHEAGFGLRPSASRQGFFGLFDDDASAARFLADPQGGLAYRLRADEFFCVRLRTCSSRGSWAGQRLALGAPPPAQGPIAALTRASIRPAAAVDFWRHAPPSERALEAAEGCRLVSAIGEAPLLRQATFTVWDSAAAMDRYARTGAHLEAIRAAQRGHHFSESLFARFVPYAAEGCWRGRSLEV